MKRFSLCLLLLVLALPAGAENLRVRVGESIAEAIAQAEPGAVIEVEPGVYNEALVVDTPNITLRGIVRGPERPVLDGKDELNDGVIASGSPFTMTGFAVRHYKGNGVSTQGVDGVFLTDLVIDDTGLYGVYPVQSRNITVTHCTVTRIRDAAIYVGESQGALVADNYVHHNVAGIEIENTDDAEVRDNLAHDNTAGILVFVLPGKVLKEGKRTRVHRNWVVRNNTPNFGDPEAIVGQLPYGIGILLMGSDDTLVENNQVRENDSLGIAITRLAAEQAKKDPPLEPMTDRARIVSNYLDANGTSPHASIGERYGGGGDFGWDGTGVGNCADLADGARTVGAPIAGCLDAALDAEASPHAAHGVEPSAAAALPPPDLSDAAAVVHIRGMRFEPRHVTVKRGQSVVWVNDDNVVHTVTSGTGTLPNHTPLSSGFLMRGQTYRHNFAEEGRFEYLCLPHLDQAAMRGATVTVEE
jgi:parallel beta-helix repeat protein